MNQSKPKNDKTKLFEEYEDGLWKVIMRNYAEKEGKELLEETKSIKDDPQFQPSAAERKKYHKLLDGELRKNKIRSLAKISKKILSRIAIFVLVLIIGFAVMFTTISAFRIKVLDFLLTFEKEYTSVRLGEAGFDEIIASGFKNTYVPTYIPAGFRIYEISNMGESKTITYINDNITDERRFIDYCEWDSSMTSNIDTENANIIKPITINENDGIFVLKGDIATVSWSNDEKLFVIIAYINEEEIIKMAESVIFIK